MTLRLFRRGMIALVLALLPGLALAQKQPVYQSGTWSAHDAVKAATNGLAHRAGGISGDANGRGINPFAVTDSKGLGFCTHSAATTGAYNALCFGHDSSGNGLITLDSYAGAAQGTLKCRVNGNTYDCLGAGGGGNVTGPGSSVVANIAAWNNTGGTLLRDGLIGINAYSGVVTGQSATGNIAAGTPLFLNKIKITSDNAAITGSGHPGVGGPFHNALNIEHNFGGAAMTGGVNALAVDALITAATSASNTNRNYVAVYGRLWGNAPDNGTGTTQATAKGAYFGGHFIGSALNGATNLLNIAGAEISVDAQTGSSGWLKSILSLVPESSDAVSFTHNVGISFGKKGGVGLDALISINDFHGLVALKATGCIICTQRVDGTASSLGTIAKGIDVSHYLFSTGAPQLKFANFSISSSSSGANARMEQVADSTRYSGGEATYTGDYRLIGNTVQTADALHDGGIEFKVSNSGNGYGTRLVANDLGAGASDFRIQTRSNSATWRDSIAIRADTSAIQINDTAAFASLVQLQGVAVASLPTCNAGTNGFSARVTDAAAPAYGAAPVGGGGLQAIVTCTNGTGWRLL